MKKSFLTLVTVLIALSINARAEQSLSLNDIDTNNCTKAQNEVNLLTTAQVRVATQCSDYAQGGYKSDNGRYYDYRLYTSAIIADDVQSGQQIKLNDINTNDCSWAQSEVSLLNGRDAIITAVCSDYIENGYQSADGRYFNYRLTTTLTIR